MLRMPYRVAGSLVQINVVENDDDLREAFAFIRSMQHRPDYTLSVDTEATGVDVYAEDFRVRTLQLGDENTAYVYRLTRSRDRNARALLEAALEFGVSLHNRPFDLLALDAIGLLSLEQTQQRARCSMLLSHLVDPRKQMDGGVGHGLKVLSEHYIDPNAPDSQSALKEEFKRLGYTLETGWKLISNQNEKYLLYAGLDVIYGSRLFAYLRRIVNERSYNELAFMEHTYQDVCMRMQRRGFRVDVEYGQWLLEHFDARIAEGNENAHSLGVQNINSTAQISKVLFDYGWNPQEYTTTGKPKLDKAVMKSILEYESTPPPVRQLIESISMSKRSGKWRTAYAQAMLDARDAHDHVHASINSLAARTGRSSISSPPLQQLPSRGDDAWLIRRMVRADEGKLIVSADLDQVEFRILAALANIQQMKYAIANNIDLHDYTAKLIWGDGFTKGQRSIGKGVGFGKVFGGGAGTLARQTGAPLELVKDAIADYERVYPELPEFQRTLINEFTQNAGYILSYYGRYLPWEAQRLYAIVNPPVQSAAADWLKRSVIRMAERDGVDDCLLLPVHDEILTQVDARDAEDLAHVLGECLSGEFIDVPISASGEVYGDTWAHGYVYTDADGVVRSKDSKNVIENWR